MLRLRLGINTLQSKYYQQDLKISITKSITSSTTWNNALMLKILFQVLLQVLLKVGVYIINDTI